MMDRTFSALVALAILDFALGTTIAYADDYLSAVDLKADDPAYQTLEADADGQRGIVGNVGVPFKARVHHRVGWTKEGFDQLRSVIKNPEYEGFGDSFPPGLRFANGLIEGTPTAAGTWKFWPAVRDRETGESPYRGQGYWWTRYRTYESKTWIEAKDPTLLVILPRPTGKEFRLQCVVSGGERHIFEIDYDNKLVKLIGGNGKIAGVYSASVDPDLIGWNKMVVLNTIAADSALLDRKTGQLTLKHFHTGGTTTAQCEKRAETQKF